MKKIHIYIILYYFLLCLEVFSALLSNQNLSYDHLYQCTEASERKKCKALPFNFDKYQCCQVNITKINEDKSEEKSYQCFPIINPSSPVKDDLKSDNVQKLFKEFIGLFLKDDLSKGEKYSKKYIIDCNDYSFQLSVDLNSYTTEEKERYANNIC